MFRRSRVRFPCLLVALVHLIGCKPPEESQLTAIVGAVLIDGSGGPPISDSVVVVAGSRIRSAGSRAGVPIPAAAEKVNGAGKFLLPGLVDLHVHLGSRARASFVTAEYTRERIEKNLNAYLFFGVTTVRSVGTDREAGFAVREAERSGALSTATLYLCGRGFTAPGGHPTQAVGDVARQPANPEDARRQVSELAAQQVDGIKIWVDGVGGTRPKISREVMQAILEEARKFRIPVTAHISTLADTQFLVDHGAAGFLHTIRDTEQIPAEFIARLRDLRLVFTPTLVREEIAWLYREHPERLDDPELKQSIDADVIAAAKAQPATPVAADFALVKRNNKRLADGGVPIGIGSDGGSSLDFPGLMTHRELELLVESGLSPSEVVVAATRNGALALGKLEQLGTIAPGKRADLMMVEANPLEDIRNLRKIDRVMLNGAWVDRARLSMK